MELDSNLAKEIFDKINEVRKYPKKIANKIAFMMSYINKRDNILREPNRNSYKLIEGIKAFEEAITFLKNFEPIEELVWEDFISKLCLDQAGEISKKGLNIYELSEIKAKYEDKLRKFGTFTNLEEICLYTDADSLHVVIDLIICDGDSSRLNRNCLLSSTFRQIGIGIEPHPRLGNVCVFYLARNWKLRNEATIHKASLQLKEENKSQSDVNFVSGTNLPDSNEKFNQTFNNRIESGIKNEYYELVAKYEKELDKEIEFDDYADKLEEKQILIEGNKLKIIKRVKYNFTDGNHRTVILSKTIKLNNSE